jgi:hypothetical protein
MAPAVPGRGAGAGWLGAADLADRGPGSPLALELETSGSVVSGIIVASPVLHSPGGTEQDQVCPREEAIMSYQAVRLNRRLASTRQPPTPRPVRQ